MNVNSVTLIGHVCHKPTVKKYGEDQILTAFQVATNRVVKDKKYTEFHNIVTFGRLAKICKDLIDKGRLVYITGRLQTKEWEDGKKIKHKDIEIVAGQMLLLEKQQALVSAAQEDDADVTEAVVELSPEMAAAR